MIFDIDESGLIFDPINPIVKVESENRVKVTPRQKIGSFNWFDYIEITRVYPIRAMTYQYNVRT